MKRHFSERPAGRSAAPTPRRVAVPTEHRPTSPAKRRLPQFTIFSLMVLTFVLSVGFAPLYYMIRSAQGETGFKMVGLLLPVVAPMLFMMVISAAYQLHRLWRGWRR
jgi:hypothetical protein